MPGKLPGFAALVKARGLPEAGNSPSIPAIYEVSLKITACNPWIFS
jgi:hypothetical protein